MDDVKDSLQIFKSSCLDINNIRPVTQNATFPYSESLIETTSPVIVAENDSPPIETSVCSGICASSVKTLETFSNIFSNDNTAHTGKDERNLFSRADSNVQESEFTADDSSKLIVFHGIEQSLKENSGDMTFDFNLKENYGKFEDNEFQSSIDFFNDPSFLNFLDNASSSTVSSIPLVDRDSLYQKFDPLYVNCISQSNNIYNEQPNAAKDDIDSKTENSANTSTFNNVQNEVKCNESLRQSIGNTLISLDSPVVDKNENYLSENLSVRNSPKLYSEEDLKKALENKELEIQGIFLRKQKDLEEVFLRKVQEFGTKFEKQKCLYNSLCIILKEAMHLINVVSDKKEVLELKLSEAEKCKNNLKEELDTFASDLQNIDHTFSDFHEKFEESTTKKWKSDEALRKYEHAAK